MVVMGTPIDGKFFWGEMREVSKKLRNDKNYSKKDWNQDIKRLNEMLRNGGTWTFDDKYLNELTHLNELAKEKGF